MSRVWYRVRPPTRDEVLRQRARLRFAAAQGPIYGGSAEVLGYAAGSPDWFGPLGLVMLAFGLLLAVAGASAVNRIGSC